jgi:hypothetical protein
MGSGVFGLILLMSSCRRDLICCAAEGFGLEAAGCGLCGLRVAQSGKQVLSGTFECRHQSYGLD